MPASLKTLEMEVTTLNLPKKTDVVLGSRVVPVVTGKDGQV